jgi:hypothetical protein
MDCLPSKLEADLGEAMIIAASSVAQLSPNSDFLDQGPLPAEVHSEVVGTEFPYHV